MFSLWFAHFFGVGVEESCAGWALTFHKEQWDLFTETGGSLMCELQTCLISHLSLQDNSVVCCKCMWQWRNKRFSLLLSRIFRQDCSVMTLKVFETAFIHSVAQWYPEFLKLFDNSFISERWRSNGMQIFLEKVINEKLYLCWKLWGLYIHLGIKAPRSCEKIIFFMGQYLKERVTAGILLVFSKWKKYGNRICWVYE